ncbi:MAG: hypothetical protein OXE42_16915 [Gammaproteobacteria bacterium]|nr:hypothetical protein [Gammaproteobacteria bacterium]
MSSVPLYKAFIEVGASEESATKASEDVIQVSQLPQLATKTDIARLERNVAADIGRLETNMAKQESRLIKWMVGSLFVFATIIIASVGILFQILLSPGVAQ